METPEGLRRLAQWYREFAEVCDTKYQQGRRDHADYLDRLAAELEKRDRGD